MKAQMYRFVVIFLLLWQGMITTLPVAAAPHTQETAVALNTPFDLVIGDEALVGEAAAAHYLFFAAVLQDSRCPIGTQCIKAGDARFQLFVSNAAHADSDMIELGTAADQRVVHYQNYVIELLDVDPSAPKPDENVILIEYHLTLVMRAATEGTPAPEPTQPAPLASPSNPLLKPHLVEQCPQFTAFDAAAILQEPVNAAEPIGNLLFGPLPAEFLDEEGGLQGFCGYASTLATAEESDPAQPHLLTDLGTAHAVVADRLSAEVVPTTNGTVLTDWVDLYALAEVVGAANPDHDSEAVFDTLYNFAGHFPLLEILRADADAAPSFTLREIPLEPTDTHEELLWLWQTLDDGYFSLLIARQGLTFDLVAARLGPQVTERTVLGYSRVILEQLTAEEAIIPSNTGRSDCDLLTLDQVAAIVGKPVQGQAVSNDKGTGCKYTPTADEATVAATDFSGNFQTHGVLAGLVSSSAAQELLNGMIDELSLTGQVTDGLAFGELLMYVKEKAWADTLSLMGQIEWGSAEWQVETLKVISDDTLLITGDGGNGWPQFFLLQPAPSGDLYYVTGVVAQPLEDAYSAIVAAARQLTIAEQPFAANPQPAATVAPTTPTTESPTAADCGGVTLAAVADLLGEPVQSQAVVGERGAGCKYIPERESAWVEPDDFSPTFESHGALIGQMPTAGAQWLLSELFGIIEESGTDVAEKTLAKLRTTLDQGDIEAALRQFAALEMTAGDWQISALPIVGEDALMMTSTMDGYQLAFFFRSQPEDGLWVIAVQLPSDRDLEAMQTTAVELLRGLGK